MNCGLANLDTLKKHLLANSMAGETRFDDVITDIGKGVATAFEKYCNRKFGREADATFICSADRDSVYLDRYPVEEISAVHFKTDQTTGWEEQTDFIVNQDDSIGFVFWGAPLAYHWSQIRFTFTGGFWFETLEPEDDGYPSTMPAAATILPADLKLAWLLQCRQVWTTLDKLGTGILTEGSQSQFVTGTLATLDLSPQVKQMINSRRRFQLI